jgi:antitoxin VapB
MGLNIKNTQTEANIRDLAARTGTSLTEAIDAAVREKLNRLDAKARPIAPEPPLLDRLQALLDSVAAERGARDDTRTSQQLLDELYDEHGLPA